MRRLSVALFGFGIFMLVAAPILRWYVEPRVVKSPLGTDASPYTSRLTLEGETQLLDRSTGNLYPSKLNGLREVRTVPQDSGRDVVVMVSFVTVWYTKPDQSKDVLTEIEQRAAFDRRTGVAKAVEGDRVDDKPVDHSGLVFKFPFNTQKNDYPFFDPRTERTWPMKYSGTETMHGLRVYRFVQHAQKTNITFIVRDEEKNKIQVPGAYENTRTVWVEPTTGLIIKGQERQKQWYHTEKGELLVYDGVLNYTDATAKNNADTARESITKIDLIGTWLPIGFLVAGVVFAVGGAWMRLAAGDAPARARRRGRDTQDRSEEEREPEESASADDVDTQRLPATTE